MKRSRLILFSILLLIVIISSCKGNTEGLEDIYEVQDIAKLGDDEMADSVVNEAPVEILSKWSRIVIDHKMRLISLFYKDKNLLNFDYDGILLGIVKGVDDEYNYDPWLLINGDKNYTPPEGLKWIKIWNVSFEKIEDGTVLLNITFETNRLAKMKIQREADNRFRFEIIPDERSVRNIAYFRFDASVSKDEAFYGLGAYLDDVNHRGKRRAMQIEVDNTESGYNEAHVPVPFLIGTSGWGWFIESVHLGAYDIASSYEDKISSIWGTGPFSKDGIRFYLFAEESPLDTIKHYYEITSYPVLPARWAIGPLLWRDENKDQNEVEKDITQMRLLDLPHTAIWIDRPYATAVNTFDFKKEQFPDPTGMISKVHSLGFKIGLWHTPYLERATGDLLLEAEKNGFFPPQTGILLNKWGKPIDFTNPDAYRWWQDHLKIYKELGISGYKLDYAEDIVPGILGIRNKWRFYDGRDERTMHYWYTILYHKVYSEILPEDGGYLLCRAGRFGGQKYASIIWPGDLDANFALHKEEVTDKNGNTFLAVGGLPASLIYGLNLSVSGYPFYGSDTGGYRHSPPDKELFTRWFQQTALSPVMQIGNSASTVAWEEDENTGYDQEMLKWYRDYTRFHLRLFPYLWTYAENIKRTGHPIMRPFGIVHPELNIHIWDQYYLGDYLLVSPVLKRGARERDVILPDGEWIDLFDKIVYKGGKSVKIAAPLNKLPLFIREDAIIPLLRPTIDTYSPTDREDMVDSYSTTPGVLYLLIFSKKRSTFELFDGTSISQKRTENGITILLQRGNEFKYGFMIELLNISSPPRSVSEKGRGLLSQKSSLDELSSSTLGYLFEASTGTLYVKVPDGELTIEL